MDIKIKTEQRTTREIEVEVRFPMYLKCGYAYDHGGSYGRHLKVDLGPSPNINGHPTLVVLTVMVSRDSQDVSGYELSRSTYPVSQVGTYLNYDGGSYYETVDEAVWIEAVAEAQRYLAGMASPPVDRATPAA